MDLLSLGFVLLIGLVSAGIAYAADMLGKKLGKKRLSLRFGRYSLRPKHVASLGTAGMGFFVSVFTILFVALVSRDVREWLVEGRQLLVQLEGRKKEVRSLEARVTELTRETKRLEDQSDSLKRQNTAQLEKLDTLNDKVTTLNGQLSTSQAALASTKLLYAESRSALEKVQAQYDQTKIQAATARRQYAETKGLLASTKGSLNATRSDLNQANAELKKATSNLKSANEKANSIAQKSLETYRKVVDLEEQLKTLQELVSRLGKERDTLVAQRDDAESKVKDAQGRYAEVQSQLDQAGRELAELQGIARQQYLFMATTFRSSRLEPMTYKAGEEVARIALPGGSDVGVAANTFASLLRTARVQAASRGAKARKREGQTFEVADVFGHLDERTGAPVSGDDLKRAVIARAAGHLEDLALVATSTLNAFAGEPVSLDVAVVPNPLVYRRNELVAEARIDGSLDEDRILEQLSEFLRGRVRERAVQDRMIPKAGTDAPFGEVKTGKVLEIVRDVKRVGRSVRVQALAAADTRAVDPLDLEFHIR